MNIDIQKHPTENTEKAVRFDSNLHKGLMRIKIEKSMFWGEKKTKNGFL